MRRVLLDEHLPRRLRTLLPGFHVQTVAEAGWSGKTNGELLRLAVGVFDVLVTADRSIPHQQNSCDRTNIKQPRQSQPTRRFDRGSVFLEDVRRLDQTLQAEVNLTAGFSDTLPSLVLTIAAYQRAGRLRVAPSLAE
jgi:hypothetical protein